MLICLNKASSVFAAIEKIAAAPGKIDKETMINQAGSASALFMRVCKAAYDPYITYGMALVPAKTPGIAPGANTLDEEWPWDTLARMQTRKLTGTVAQTAVQRAIDFLDAPSAELFRRIIRKDLRAGFSEGTINRVFPKTLAEFPYMRCSLPDKSDMPKWDWSQGIIVQEKADGMFANTDVDEAGQVTLSTRQGSVIPLDNLLEFGKCLSATLAHGTQTHGELTIVKDGVTLPREIGNGMWSHIIAGGSLESGYLPRLDAWDQIPAAAVVKKGRCEIPYGERLMALAKQVKNAGTLAAGAVVVIPTRIVKTKADAWTYYRELLAKGKEGVVCKTRTAIWKDGTSKEQVKLKMEVDVDLEIVNVLVGTPGTKNDGRPGSLECRTACSELSVAVTVKNEKMREALEKDPDAFIGKVIVVRANAIMAPSEDKASGLHSLFLPRFVEDQVRADKDIADDLEAVKAIFRNAVETA